MNRRFSPTALECPSGMEMHLLAFMPALRVTSPPCSRQCDVICCDLKAKQLFSQTFERGTTPLSASNALESMCASRAALLVQHSEAFLPFLTNTGRRRVSHNLQRGRKNTSLARSQRESRAEATNWNMFS